MSSYAIAYSTVAKETDARTLARALVSSGAAACVTIIPEARSCYKWKGELCEESEWLLMIKTRLDKQAEIEALFRGMHPYECPELILLPVAAGKKAYLDWLDAGLDAPSEPG